MIRSSRSDSRKRPLDLGWQGAVQFDFLDPLAQLQSVLMAKFAPGPARTSLDVMNPVAGVGRRFRKVEFGAQRGHGLRLHAKATRWAPVILVWEYCISGQRGQLFQVFGVEQAGVKMGQYKIGVQIVAHDGVRKPPGREARP